MEGWIKLHRKIIENCIFEKPEYLKLWIYLLCVASHKETEFIMNNKNEILKPGQLLTGRKKMSMETGISETTIERILEYLENGQQIGQQKTSRFRIITITKWEEYQQNGQQNGQQTDNKRTTNGQQTDTFKNVKNEKNGKNVKKKEKTFLSDSDEYGLAEHLYKQIELNEYKVPKPNLQVWARHVDLLIRIDKKMPEDIRKVIDWAMKDKFWYMNILSTEKLRKQFTQLQMRMQKEKHADKETTYYTE